jgi:uncharacterized RDD family membrane protein YckC
MVLSRGDFLTRFFAALIDSTVLLLLNSIFQVALADGAISRVSSNGLGVTLLISIAVACGYETFFLGKMGATPGKMVLGLKVVRPDGSPVGYGRAAGRYFATILSTIIFGIGYIIAGFDYRNRALHDMICDTRVISVEAETLPAPAPMTGFEFRVLLAG